MSDILLIMTTSPDIEKLFLEYIAKMGETPGGYSGLLKLEDLEKGGSKILGEEMQQEADILEQEINYMNFEP